LAGVLGQDLASGGSNAGVVGTSVTDIGVLGTTMKSGTGVWGKVGNGTGVFGESANGFGVSGEVTTLSTHGAGVLGVGLSGGRGVIGTVGSANAFIVPATPAAGVDGIAGYGGNGVRAENFATPLPLPTAIGAAYQNAALAVLSASGGNIPLIVARTNTSDKMSLDSNGNMILAGTLTTKGTPLIVHRTTDGSSIGTYTSEQSLPSIEDFGKARLVSGQAYVYIDAAFASTIDPRADYLVFLTPEGDSRGLYVTDKSMRGFVVRENQGGRSTLAFDYRIVAKPADSTERRLPLIKASLLGSGTLPQVVQIRGHMLVP
jgi:hypothetical protein